MNKIIIAFLLLLCLSVSASAQSPLPDFGPFNPQSIPLEFQSWWEPCCGHVHVAARLPIKGTMSGVVIVPLRVVLHHHTGTLDSVTIGAENTDGELLRFDPPLRCAEAICAWNFDFRLDTTRMPDGWRELRVKARTTSPDGSDFYNSSGVSVYIDNGKPDNNFLRRCDNLALMGRAWYDGPEYTNAAIECAPITPVSGIVTWGFRAQEPSQRLIADIDKTHYIPPVGTWPEQLANTGINIMDKAGNFQTFQRVQFDTRTLANGWHSLRVRSESPDGHVSVCATCPPGVVSRSSGVVKIWFYVQN